VLQPQRLNLRAVIAAIGELKSLPTPTVTREENRGGGIKRNVPTTTGIRALLTRGTYAVRHDVQTVVGRIATTCRAVLRSRRAYIGSIVAGAADCTIYSGPKKRRRTRLQMKDTAPKRYIVYKDNRESSRRAAQHAATAIRLACGGGLGVYIYIIIQ